ncbi:MAG: hypothetical protein ACPGCS_00150 [Opitutales bacterium]
MKPKQATKGISRVDTDSTHGWLVRSYKNGKTYSKLFSDAKHGGQGAAFELAKAYKVTLEEEMTAIPAKKRRRRIVHSDARNTTGELGVTRVSRTTASGAQIEFYAVSWRPEPGVQKRTSFSIRKYGEGRAFRMAVAHRRKMMRASHGKNFYRKRRYRKRQAKAD